MARGPIQVCTGIIVEVDGREHRFTNGDKAREFAMTEGSRIMAMAQKEMLLYGDCTFALPSIRYEHQEFDPARPVIWPSLDEEY